MGDDVPAKPIGDQLNGFRRLSRALSRPPKGPNRKFQDLFSTIGRPNISPPKVMPFRDLSRAISGEFSGNVPEKKNGEKNGKIPDKSRINPGQITEISGYVWARDRMFVPGREILLFR